MIQFAAQHIFSYFYLLFSFIYLFSYLYSSERLSGSPVLGVQYFCLIILPFSYLLYNSYRYGTVPTGFEIRHPSKFPYKIDDVILLHSTGQGCGSGLI
jgi:hypothetical protein